MNVGEKIRAMRLVLNMTQAMLAQEAGVSRPLIAQYERGTKVPTVYMAKILADIFGCKVDELLT